MFVLIYIGNFENSDFCNIMLSLSAMPKILQFVSFVYNTASSVELLSMLSAILYS